MIRFDEFLSLRVEADTTSCRPVIVPCDIGMSSMLGKLIYGRAMRLILFPDSMRSKPRRILGSFQHAPFQSYRRCESKFVQRVSHSIELCKLDYSSCNNQNPLLLVGIIFFIAKMPTNVSKGFMDDRRNIPALACLVIGTNPSLGNSMICATLGQSRRGWLVLDNSKQST